MCSSLYISLVRAYGPARHFRAAAMGSTGTQHRVTAVFPCQHCFAIPGPRSQAGPGTLRTGCRLHRGWSPALYKTVPRRIAYNILLWALLLCGALRPSAAACSACAAADWLCVWLFLRLALFALDKQFCLIRASCFSAAFGSIPYCVSTRRYPRLHFLAERKSISPPPITLHLRGRCPCVLKLCNLSLLAM